MFGSFLIRKNIFLLSIFILLNLLISPVQASQPDDKDWKNNIPEQLQQWIPWVLKDYEDDKCPFGYNNIHQKICYWPSKLSLDIDSKSVKFSQQVTIEKKSYVFLLGNEQFWPQDVKVNREIAIIAKKEASPVVYLDKGDYLIEGVVNWNITPSYINLPKKRGLIDITLNGEKVDFPVIKNGDQLWLGKTETKPDKLTENDRLDIRVFRKIIDDNPMFIDTKLILNVSGKERSVTLNDYLLKGTTPIKLKSSLPVNMQSDKRITLQLKPGSWEINARSYIHQPVEKISLQEFKSPMPNEEVWVFEEKGYLRFVTVDGLPSIDASRTDLPSNWKNLPAYHVKAGDSLKFIQKKRGQTNVKKDVLSLKRDMWLNFDGTGYFVKDYINGKINKSSRLNVQNEFSLGRVLVNNIPQSISKLLYKSDSGIEVREGSISIEAEGKIDNKISDFSAVSWNSSFDNVKTVLNLPPGWSAFYISSVDKVYSTWVGKWTLLTLFLVLVTSFAIFRMMGFIAGFIGLLALTLTEQMLPISSVILVILACQALLMVVNTGKFQTLIKFIKNSSMLGLVLAIIFFVYSDVRTAIYPQLKGFYYNDNISVSTTLGRYGNRADQYMSAPVSRQSFIEEMPNLVQNDFAQNELEYDNQGYSRAAKPMAQKKLYKKEVKRKYLYDSKNIVQTGYGTQNWHGTKINLSWNGPVSANQKIGVYLISPAQNLIIAIARLVLLALLLLVLIDNKLLELVKKRLKSSLSASSKGAAVAIFALVVTIMMPSESLAYKKSSTQASLKEGGNLNINDSNISIPSDDLLKQMRKYIISEIDKNPECLPNCAQISRARLDIQDLQFILRLEYHVKTDVAVPLPDASNKWKIKRAKIVANENDLKLYKENGTLWAYMTKGINQLIITGILLDSDNINIDFPLEPHMLEQNIAGWKLFGVDKNGKISKSIKLSRIRSENIIEEKKKNKFTNKIAISPLVKIERNMSLDKNWTVETVVTRLSSNQDSIDIAVPLLPTESVISSSMKIDKNKILVSIEQNSHTVSWSSILDNKKTKLNLTAAKNEPWVEVWNLDISSLWHVNFSGTPQIYVDNISDSTKKWQPWPGETLSMNIIAPQAVLGATKTIKNVSLNLDVGQSITESNLEFKLLSSIGETHNIKLPADANLVSVTNNSKSQPSELKGQNLSINITPGEQVIKVKWTQNNSSKLRFESPEIDLGLPAVNIETKIKLPKNRWVLFVKNELVGPAILIWGVLPVILLISLIIGFGVKTPLTFISCFVLLLGLSQTDIALNFIIIGWFVAMSVRYDQKLNNTNKPSNKRALLFNLQQFILACWTIIAIFGLFSAISQGLLGSPDMKISGNGSSSYNLIWYDDFSGNIMPKYWIISFNVIFYRVLMLFWALWLAAKSLNWIKWAWQCYSKGDYWLSISFRKSKKKA